MAKKDTMVLYYLVIALAFFWLYLQGKSLQAYREQQAKQGQVAGTAPTGGGEAATSSILSWWENLKAAFSGNQQTQGSVPAPAPGTSPTAPSQSTPAPFDNPQQGESTTIWRIVPICYGAENYIRQHFQFAGSELTLRPDPLITSNYLKLAPGELDGNLLYRQKYVREVFGQTQAFQDWLQRTPSLFDTYRAWLLSGAKGSWTYRDKVMIDPSFLGSSLYENRPAGR